MVDELLYRNPVSFDILYQIAEKALRLKVKQWCRVGDCLWGKGDEEDIMQILFLKLMQKTVSGFLRHPGRTDAYNNNPEGFQNWLFKVAENLKKDFAKNTPAGFSNGGGSVQTLHNAFTRHHLDGSFRAFLPEKLTGANCEEKQRISGENRFLLVISIRKTIRTGE